MKTQRVQREWNHSLGLVYIDVPKQQNCCISMDKGDLINSLFMVNKPIY